MSTPVELATAYIALVPSARGIAASTAAELGAPLEAAAVTSGARASKGFASSFESGVGGLGSVLKKALPVVAVAAIGEGLISLGDQFHEAYKRIRVDTGATGDALKGLEDDFKAVAAIRPDSFASVSEAVTKLNVGLGLTGKPLQDMAAQVLRLSSITKTDLGANLDATTKLMNNFSVATADQGARLDELFRASQATGVSVADLASAMATGGSVLRTVGLDFDQSAALLGLLGKVGVEATAVLAPLSRSIATAAKEGKSASTVFTEVFDAIRAAPDETSAAGKAIDVFGAKAGPKLAGLIREGKLSYQQLADTIANGTDTIAAAAAETATFGGKFKIFKNSLAVAFEPLAIRSVEGATKAMTALQPHLAAFSTTIGNVVSATAKFFDLHPEIAFGALAAVLGVLLLPAVSSIGLKLFGLLNPMSLVVVALVALAAGAVWAYTHVASFRAVVDKAFDGLSGVFSVGVDAVQGFFAAFDGAGVSSDGVVGAFERIGVKAREVVDRISGLDADAIFTRIATSAGKVTTALVGQRDIIVPLVAGLSTFLLTLAAFNKASSGISTVSTVLKAVGPLLGAALAPLAAAGGVVVLIVAAVLAVGVAFFVAYKQVKPFRDAVDNVVSIVKDKALAAFRTLRSVADTIAGAVQSAGDALSAFGKGAQAGAAAVKEALAPLARFFNDNVLSTFSAAVGFFGALFDRIRNVIEIGLVPIKQTLAVVEAIFEAAFEPARVIVEAVLTQIVTNVKGFVAVMRPIFETAFDAMRIVVETAFGAIQAVIESVLGVIRGLFEVGEGVLRGDFSKIWEGLVDIVATPFNAVRDFISGTLDNIVGFFQDLPFRLASTAVGMWDFIKDSFKNTLNALIDLWDSLEIPSFTIGGWDTPFGSLPGFDTPAIPFPDIPHLALGGIVSHPTFALIGEGKQPEAVAPLSDLKSMIAEAVATADVAAAPAPQGGDGGIRIDSVTLVGEAAHDPFALLAGKLRQAITIARR